MIRSAAYYKYQAKARSERIQQTGSSHSLTRARNNLIRMTEFTYPQYRTERAHQVIASFLERCIRKEIKRGMIFAPPQHGKSELSSVRLPAYALGKHPDEPIIMTGYSADLTTKFSSEVRSVVKSDEYRELFPEIEISSETSAKDLWKLKKYRGYLRAAGVGGGITGLGAMLGLIDDPIASWAEAQSETVRNKVWDWYKGTFRTRIWTGGVILLVMTRWHEDDLAGRLLLANPGQWSVLRLPAIAEDQDDRDSYAEKYGLPLGEPDPLGREPGEVLAPIRYPPEEIELLRTEVGSMVFSAQYQANPRPPEGNVFKEWWFPPEIFLDGEWIDQHVEFAGFIRFWDKAGTDDAGAYTVGLLMGVDRDGLYYVMDVKREQLSAFKRNEMMRETAKLDYKRYGYDVQIWIEQEPGSGGKESAEISIRQLAGFPVNVERPMDSKGVRLRPFAAQCEAGNVRIKKGGWNNAYIAELLEWSEKAKYVDQVDASSGAFNHLTLEGPMADDRAKQLARSLMGRGRGPRR